MRKRIAVIERCADCPDAADVETDKVRFHTCMEMDDRKCPEAGIPIWCPLPELPKRKKGAYSGFEYNYVLGYNDCLDDIEGCGEGEQANNCD